jgi:hypothetical protein
MSDRIIKTIINEASLNRIHQHTHGRNIGIMSAFRGERTSAENETHHRELGNKIRKAGFGYIKAHGGYYENKGTPEERYVKEKSYIVVGKRGHDNGNLLGHMKKWGTEHNQDGIIHKSHDNEEATHHGLKKGVDTFSAGKWHPQRHGEYATYIRGGKRNFQFGESVETPIEYDVKFYVPAASPQVKGDLEFV